MLIYGARAATGQEEQQLFDARLECLLECWRTLRFTPLPSSVANLRKFIAAGSRKQQGSEWTMDTLEVSSDGKCSNGAQLPKSKYASADLKRLSESLRCVAIQSGYNKDEYMNAFRHFDSVLDWCPRFDVVVDGMNVIRMPWPDRDQNPSKITKMGKLMQGMRDIHAEHVLLIFKSHMKGKFKTQFMAKYPNACLYFVENTLQSDAFVLYAALKCHSFILTHSRSFYYIFHMPDFGERELLEDWVFNRKMKIDTTSNTITFPYSFKPVVQPMSCAPAGDKHWLVPAFSVDNPPHTEPDYLDVFYDVHKTIVTKK